MNDINERLVILRKNLGISQLEFANNLNIKRQTIAHLEGKNVALSVELLKSICQFYKVNETWLLYGTGEMLTDAKKYTAVDLHKVTNDGVRICRQCNYITIQKSIFCFHDMANPVQ